MKFWPKSDFLGFWSKFSKIRINQKSEKNSLETIFRWLWQIFGDFCPKIFFSPLLKKKKKKKKKVGPKNHFFGDISKI